MPNRNKEKGDRFEYAALLSAREYFPEAFRTRAGWDDDRGDLGLTKDYRFIEQLKDCASKPWGVWLDELDKQMINAGAQYGAVSVKRRGISDAGEALTFMRRRNYLKMAHDLAIRL